LVLIFTDNEQLDRDLNKKIEDSRIVYYPDYILEEQQATTLIATLQPNKYNFKDFMFKVREKNIQVILILENENVKDLKDALMLGIYDFVFDPFDLEDVCKKITNPNPFSKVSQYIKNFLELDN
jgi:DNA-binding NtrC family response regulator